MFLLLSGRHVGAHLGGHQHGDSIQISINLGETFRRISSIRKIAVTCESLCISTSFLFPDSGLNLLNGFDFLFWMAWHWKPAIGDKSASSFDQRWYVLNSRKQASTIQSCPVKNIRKVSKKEQNEANCTNPFTCNCKNTTDKLFQMPYFIWTWLQHTISTSILFACVLCHLPRRQQVCTRNQLNTNCTSAQSSLTSETRHFDALTHNLYFCAYSGLQNTLKIH